QLCSDGKEVHPIVPMHRTVTHQAKVGLVHQRCTLQGVIGTLPSQAVSCHATEFIVDQREELLAGSVFSLTPTGEQFGDLIGGIRALEHLPSGNTQRHCTKANPLSRESQLPPRS